MALREGIGPLQAKATLAAGGRLTMLGGGRLAAKASLVAGGERGTPTVAQSFELSGNILYRKEPV